MKLTHILQVEALLAAKILKLGVCYIFKVYLKNQDITYVYPNFDQNYFQHLNHGNNYHVSASAHFG